MAQRLTKHVDAVYCCAVRSRSSCAFRDSDADNSDLVRCRVNDSTYFHKLDDADQMMSQAPAQYSPTDGGS